MIDKDETRLPESIPAGPAQSSTDKPRSLVGRYRLDELVADGEFAQLWRGYDLELRQAVAVKVLNSGRLESAEAFLAGSRRIALLNHPGIVPIHAVEQEGTTNFIVSDFVDGGSLIDYIGRQIVSTSQATRWATDVAETLQYAHENGVVHARLKPSNILIGDHGRALLADFGGAHLAITTDRVSPSTSSLRYLSPEQLQKNMPNPRSDIYSLGVVLHELLTGKLPYSSTDPNVLRREIVSGARIDSVSLPAKLRRICLQALQQDQERRYASAGQLVDDLRQSAVGSSARRVLVSVIGVILFAAGFSIASLWQTSEPRQARRSQSAVATIEAAWNAYVIALPVNEQSAAVAARLVELNKGFNGEVKQTIERGEVVGLEFLTDDVQDISPVLALTGLKSLICNGTYTTQSNGKLADLSQLRGMKLTNLSCDFNERISDLTPLQGMPLGYLNCARTNVKDLIPLRNMPLTVVVCGYTSVADLSPLSGMNLKELYCEHTKVSDLMPLEGMPLEQFNCTDTLVNSLEPLRGVPLKRLECHRTGIADLSPLKRMSELSALNILDTKVDDLSALKELPNLKMLWCEVVSERDAELLRSLKSLEFINNNPFTDFWNERDEKPSTP